MMVTAITGQIECRKWYDLKKFGETSITDTMRHPMQTLKNYNKQNESFRALKDVNFEVNRGEVVGSIGRNGAGYEGCGFLDEMSGKIGDVSGAVGAICESPYRGILLIGHGNI